MKRNLALALIAAFVLAAPVMAGTDEKAENAKTTVLAIEGMTCGGCTAKVEAKLKETEGVISYDVSLDEKEAKVQYDPDRTDPEKIVKAISTTGFKCKVKDGEEESGKA